MYKVEVVDKNCSIDDWDKAKHILGCIEKLCQCGGYVQGYRNDIAVDFTCACWVINADPYRVAKELSINDEEYRDLEDRINVIYGYCRSWDDEPNGVFDKMLMLDTWAGVSEPAEFIEFGN